MCFHYLQNYSKCFVILNNEYTCLCLYMHFITSYDVLISPMQTEGLLNNVDAKTVAFDIIFVVKTSKKTPGRHA